MIYLFQYKLLNLIIQVFVYKIIYLFLHLIYNGFNKENPKKVNEVELTVKLKEVLNERGMSQIELAEKTGLTRTVISEMATNRRTSINREQITKIIQALEITDMNEIFEVM